jgi:hypothetical protein
MTPGDGLEVMTSGGASESESEFTSITEAVVEIRDFDIGGATLVDDNPSVSRRDCTADAPRPRPLQPLSVPLPLPSPLPITPSLARCWESFESPIFRLLPRKSAGSSIDICPRARASPNFRFFSSTRCVLGQRFFLSAIQASRTSGSSRLTVVP